MVSHLQVLCTMEELTVHYVLVFQRMNAKSMSLGDLLPEKMRKFFFFFLWKRRQYFPTKVHLVKAMVFPVVMYVCESWTIKKAECWWIGTFELWCWRRLLKVSWTARRSNQSILNEISPEYSLEGLMLKLKLQYFGHLAVKNWLTGKLWCLERLKAEGEGDDRGWDGWMASLTRWTWVWVSSGSWWWTGRPGMPQSIGSQRVGCDWTELKCQELF